MTLIARSSFPISHSSLRIRYSASILTNLKGCKTIRSLEQVHAQIIQKGCHQDAFLLTKFISLCISFSSNLSYPTCIFESINQPNIYLWNTLLEGYCLHSSLSNCIALFNRMTKSLGVLLGDAAFPPLVNNCAKALALREGQALHGFVVRYGIESDVFVGSSLINFYGKCREVECARKVFDGMPVTNEVSWTAMILGCMISGDALEANNLFDKMPKRNSHSWNVMIKGFVKLGDLDSARRLFDGMPRRDVFSYTAMVDGYAKAGDMVSARMLFEQSEHKNLVLWSALIAGYAQNGLSKKAIQMFYKMQSLSIQPDKYVMVSLMSACSQLGSLELAKLIDSYLHSGSFDLCQGHVAAALVDMNAKCGNIERALTLFEQLPTRDVVSYCSIIQGLSIHGRGPQAVALFDRMLKDRIVPDSIAFTVILTACSQAGLVEEGCRYFDSMVKEYLLKPSPDQYACVIDLLGRSGKLKTAYELLKSMPVEPHPATWGALLGACKLHCNLELGEEVARKLIELEPLNAGNYMMLSSIYAAANRWSEASDLKIEMTERGLKKIPGSTWIQVWNLWCNEAVVD